jgi:hypothetical protein
MASPRSSAESSGALGDLLFVVASGGFGGLLVAADLVGVAVGGVSRGWDGGGAVGGEPEHDGSGDVRVGQWRAAVDQMG